MSQLHPRLHLGTSSWSSKDWEGVFYPAGIAPRDMLGHYATRLSCVEADSTFYGPPAAATVRRWRGILPEGFRFTAKVPKVITHEKVMEGCDEEMAAFVAVMDELGERLGPLLPQFPYFSKASGMTQPAFLSRLGSFLPRLPAGHRFALEIRNKEWLEPPLLELLARHNVAVALIDHPWMPRIDRMMDSIDPLTADFTSVRWLGDRHGIERRTLQWDKLIVDRTADMRLWIPALRSLLARATVYGFFNNHYAGHAPGSIALLEKLWNEEPVTPPA